MALFLIGQMQQRQPKNLAALKFFLILCHQIFKVLSQWKVWQKIATSKLQIFRVDWSMKHKHKVALRYGEASGFGLSALMAAGLALFAVTLVVNFTASWFVARSRSGASSEA